MYIIGTIDNPFEDDTMQEGEMYSIQQEGEAAEQADEQEESKKETETD